MYGRGIFSKGTFLSNSGDYFLVLVRTDDVVGLLATRRKDQP